LDVLPIAHLCFDWKPLVIQSKGCLASALARLAVYKGEEVATQLLQLECGRRIPKDVIEAGLLQKTRFEYMS